MSSSSYSSSDSDEINLVNANNVKQPASLSSSDSESEDENNKVSQVVKKNDESQSSSNGTGDSSSDSESASDAQAAIVHKSVFGSDSETDNPHLENKFSNKHQPRIVDGPEFSSSESENETNISSVINKSVIQSLPSESNSNSDNDETDIIIPPQSITERVEAQSEVANSDEVLYENMPIEKVSKQMSQSSTSSSGSSSDDSEEDATTTTLQTTRKDVFGSDSESEEDVSSLKTEIRQRSTKEIFGDDQDDTSSDSDTAKKLKINNAKVHEDSQQYVDEDADVGSGGEQEAPVPEDTRIQVDFPLIRANLGKQIHFVKLPNFLSVETRPFDPATYEDELDEDDLHDEEGRARLKLKVENTVRWRYAHDADGNERHDEYGAPIRESNAKFMRWSDGSLSLHLGSEIFDVHVMETTNDYNHLFIRQGSGLQGQAVFGTKLTFRPHSIDSYTHRKITMSLADKSTKQQMVKFLPIAGKDPTVQHQEAMKREEEGFRASLRRENQQRRIRERVSSRGRLSAAFIEDEGEKDGGSSTSIAAIKRKAKERKSVSAVYSSSDDDSLSSDSSADAAGKKKKARVISEDEDDEVEITGSKSVVVNDATSSSDDDDAPAGAKSKVAETSDDDSGEVTPSVKKGVSTRKALTSSSDSDTSISD